MRAFSRRAVALMLSIALVDPGIGNGVGLARARTPEPQAVPIADLRGATQRILAAAPASDLDVDQKAVALGADVNRIFAFVRDTIREQVYPGALRGARGALTSRAGNSWDKAALLAALLGHHGREVRFVRARLAPDRAAAIVTKMFTQAPSTAKLPQIDMPAALVARSREMATRLEARWHSAENDLLGALDRAGIALGQTQPIADATLLDEAADHVWIEYKDADRWVALDPTLPSQAGEKFTPVAVESFAEIPDARHHHVTFRVKAEVRVNGVLNERDVLTWSSTAAALHAASVVFANTIDATLTGQWRATPTLYVDGRGHSGSSLTETGVQAPPRASGPGGSLIDDASRQVGGVGRVTEMFGGAAPPPTPTSQLTAVWLEIEFRGPAGPAETVRRDLLDRIGLVERARGRAATAPVAAAAEAPLALRAIHACAVTSGPMNPRVVGQRLASTLPALEEATTQVPAASRAAPSASEAWVGRLADSLQTILTVAAQNIHVLSNGLAARVKPAAGALLFFEATPRLAIVSLDPNAPGLTVDLPRDPLRVVARGVPARDVVRANLARGVLDSVLEDALVGSASSDAAKATPLSTVEVFARARADQIKVLVLRSGGDLTALTATDVARVRLTRSLKDHIVVAPERAPAIGGVQRFAWWEVDPSTGATVGVLETGLHGAQAIPEHATIGQALRAGLWWLITSDTTWPYAAGALSLAVNFVLVQVAGMLGLLGPYFDGFFAP